MQEYLRLERGFEGIIKKDGAVHLVFLLFYAGKERRNGAFRWEFNKFLLKFPA